MDLNNMTFIRGIKDENLVSLIEAMHNMFKDGDIFADKDYLY